MLLDLLSHFCSAERLMRASMLNELLYTSGADCYFFSHTIFHMRLKVNSLSEVIVLSVQI